MPQVDKREHYYLETMRHHSAKYEDFDWPSVELMVNLVYTYDLVQTHLARAVEAQGLSLAAFNVLMILSRCEGERCPMHELGKVLLVSRANVTGLVDSLERKNLVERVADATDRRVRLVHMTKTGRKLLAATAPRHFARVRELLKEIKAGEKATLSALLAKMRRGVQGSIGKGMTGTK